MTSNRALVAIGTFVAAVLHPALVQACPVCAGRSDDVGANTRGILIGLIIFFPFAVVYAVIRFMRSQTTDTWNPRASFVRPESEDRPSKDSLSTLLTMGPQAAPNPGAPSAPGNKI